MSTERADPAPPVSADEKRALLRRLLEQHAGPRRATGLEPLSHGQQALWYVQQVDPQSWAYNIALTMALPAAASAEMVRRAVTVVTERHEMLRSTFESREGVPGRRVHEEARLVFEVFIDRTTPTQIYEDALEFFERPFDLEAGPLVRASYWTLPNSNNLFVLITPHIVSDAVSMSVLEHEIQQIVADLIAGNPISPVPPEPSYTAYVRWQSELLAGPEGERMRNYWEQTLPERLPRLRWVGGRNGEVSGRRKEVVQFQIDSDLCAQIFDFIRQEGVTFFVLLLSAFGIALGREGKAPLVPVGTAALGRNHPAFRRAVGYFANPVLLTVDLAGGGTLRDLLERVRSMTLGALEHQDYPLSRLATRLRGEGGVSQPLFQAMFMHQGLNSLTTAAGVPMPERYQYAVDREASRTIMPALASRGGESEILLETATIGKDLYGSLAYDTHVMNEAQASALIASLEDVLRSMVEQIDRPLEEILGDEGASSGARLSEHAGQRCIHQAFLEQAARNPEWVAIDHGHTQYSYRELEAASTEVARALVLAGVKPGAIVPLLLDRSIEAIVSMLAVLRCGAAYLPIDPEQPLAHIRTILQVARAKVALTSAPYADHLTDAGLDRVLLVESSKVVGAPDVPLPEVDDPEMPAYVMFTSGTTGKPKGVVVPHRAVTSLVRETDYVQLTEDDRLAQVSNLAFDASTFEIWGALLNGGQVVIINREVVLAPRKLARALEEERITTLFLTTSLFNLMVNEVPGCLAPVRRVLFGGEAVDVDSVRRALSEGPPRDLLHVYGPTECTTFATWYRVDRLDPDATTIPIGHPIARAELFVLDEHGQEVAVGEPGELYIGGEGLAVGYLRDANRTAQRFVSHPTRTGSRVYRTGDRVRLQEDGNVVFLGRVDRQVKIRGHRVELEAIESVLAGHRSVRFCAVETRRAADGTRSLVAFYVPQPDSGLEPSGVRTFLSERLPSFMVPSTIERLSELPLSANGKIDRSRLASGIISAADEEVEIPLVKAPRDVIELRLLEIWEELLGVRSIGLEDNFFDLGGHSLLAARLVSRIEAELDQSIPLGTILTAPTISQLAEILRLRTPVEVAPALVPIRARGARDRLYCIPGAGGTSIMFYQLARHLDGEQPVFGIEAKAFLEGEVRRTSIEELAAHAISIMREAQPNGPYRLCGFSAGGLVAYEMAQQLRAVGQTVELLALLDTFNPHALPFARRRAIRQWRRLRSLSWSEQFAYIRKRLADKGRSLLRRLRRNVSYRVQKRGGMVRQGLMQAQVMARQSRAAYRYVPQPYPGRVTLVRSQQKLETGRVDSDDFGWSRLVDDLEVLRVPALHHEMMREPHVQHLARVLDACLSR